MIQFNNVCKDYHAGNKDIAALKDVNISINDGEFVFILGASGAGKSTFLKLIMREERPTSGEILVDGQELGKMRRGKVPYYRRKMGIVFQPDTRWI